MFGLACLSLREHIWMLQNPELIGRIFIPLFSQIFHFLKTISIRGQVLILTYSQSWFDYDVIHKCQPYVQSKYLFIIKKLVMNKIMDHTDLYVMCVNHE